jgi:uncharacterized protein (UPF0332 family)
MSRLSRHLLEQARHLTTRDAGRPRQANVRRAVSAAYYALFHFLTAKACRALLGSSPARRAIRVAFERSFNHAPMRNAARSFASGNLPGALGVVLGAVPAELRRIARAFSEAQDERHQADYNNGVRFTRARALGVIGEVEAAIALWPTVRHTDAARLYLVALLTGDSVRSR